MAIKTKLEHCAKGKKSLVMTDDGSGELNQVMKNLCQSHRTNNIKESNSLNDCRGILRPIGEDEEINLEEELEVDDID